MRIRSSNVYQGRLAFDPDSQFHLAENGKKVVTDDGGLSWRYATRKDQPHNSRYQTRVAVIDGTKPDSGEAHHYQVQPGDRHYDGIQFWPDDKAAVQTGHTEAYRG